MPVGGLTAVVAERGYGKTTVLQQLAESDPAAWHVCTADDAGPGRLARGLVDALRLRLPELPPEVAPLGGTPHHTGFPTAGVPPLDYAAALAGALDATLDGPVTLVLDDVHELGVNGEGIELLDALVRTAPRHLRLVLLSRVPLPFPIERVRSQGRLLEIGPRDLRFTVEEVDALLEQGLDLGLDGGAADLAAQVHAATAGWPVAVRLALAHLEPLAHADRGPHLRRLLDGHGPLLDSLEVLLLAGEPSVAIEALQQLAPLPWFSAALCAALGIGEPDRLLRTFGERGLVVAAAPPHEDEVRIAPVLRTLLLERRPLDPGERRRVLSSAAKWFSSHGRHGEALGCLVDADDDVGITTLLRDHGLDLLHRGEAHLLRTAVAALPGGPAEPGLKLLLAQAHQQGGDWDEAERLYADVDGGGPLPPGLAWRMGSLRYQRGDLPGAVEVCERADLDRADTADEAMVLAWLSAARFRLGDVDTCVEVTGRALRAANLAGDDTARSTAHTAAAMLAAMAGDRAANDHHYLLGLDAAVRAGDVAQVLRIRTNRSANFVEQGAYLEGLAEATVAIELAEGSGVTSFLGTSLVNRGDAHRHLGDLERAMADFEAARAWYERLGPTLVGYALQGIADVHLARGHRTVAAAHYREAIDLAERAGDQHALAPALTGLARATCPDDAQGAAALARRAVALGPGSALVDAMTALATSELALGAPEEAQAIVADALVEAGRRRDRRGMAQCLELRAAADPDHPGSMSWLQEARDVWEELGSPRGAARVVLAQAARSDGARRRSLASEAAAVFAELGIRDQAAVAMALAGEPDGISTAVGVRALGDFRVLREGVPVPLGEWGSRKARDLLKVLVARRGRGIPREQLAALLWPHEDPGRTVSRLSVQVSTLRAVLDPAHARPADHFVVTEGGTVRLDLQAVVVDVDRFLLLADEAVDRAARGEAAALPLLTRAEAMYTGDLLQSDAYADWAVPLRDEARAGYIEVARALAGLRAGAGDAAGAARMYRRLLEHDRYDEQAHLGLIGVLAASGRHGEARRSHAAYASAIAEIGVEPHAYPHPPAS